jgi:hypothetical protein
VLARTLDKAITSTKGGNQRLEIHIPYEFTSLFSAEFGAVVDGLARSSHCFIKSSETHPVSGAETRAPHPRAAVFQPTTVMAPRTGNGGSGMTRMRALRYAPAA